MVEPTDLIAVARLLASGAAPTDAALRRSVSTAYYALFHAIAAFAADRLVSPADPSAAYALVYRGIDHKKIKDVLEEVAKPTLRSAVRKALVRTAISARLRSFADVFVPMQQLRHSADYHPAIALSQSDVNDLVDEAENALKSFLMIDRTELTDVVVYILLGARAS